jgi:protein TonB
MKQGNGPSPAHDRYCERPMGWQTRLFGIGGTAMVMALILAFALFTWRVIRPTILSSSAPLVVELRPLAAPPEPVRAVAPGVEQIEKQEAKPVPQSEMPSIPIIAIPLVSSIRTEVQKPVEIADPGPSVADTTAPRSITAPTVNRLSSQVRPDWESLILAHLERFRRYPARARAARQQGTAHIHFAMNRVGTVLSSAIVRKSGSFDLDQAALDTLRRAQPLPNIPADRPDVVELTIPVTFSLR